MIAIKGMTMSKDSEGCISCAFHWNGDSTTYCLAQSHPYSPAGERLHHINYDDPNNPYGGEEGLTREEVYKNCITWRESTCPLIEVEPQESEEISETNMKMWEEIFKAESEVRNDKSL